jgi:hypothetical protein
MKQESWQAVKSIGGYSKQLLFFYPDKLSPGSVLQFSFEECTYPLFLSNMLWNKQRTLTPCLRDRHVTKGLSEPLKS